MVANSQIIPYQPQTIARPIIPTKDEVEALWLIAEKAAKSVLSKHKTPQDAFFVMGYGQELGIPPMTALRTIYSVQGGAPSCSGEAMLALIRKSGKAEIRLPSMENITDKASVWMKRRDTGEEFTASFSMKDAEKAGLVKTGGNWAKYPKNMLLWRCVSFAARFLFSDVIGGLYTLEEIAPNTPVDEMGAPIGEIVIEKPAEVIEADFTPAELPPPNVDTPPAATPWTDETAIAWVNKQIERGHPDTELRTALLIESKWSEWDGTVEEADKALDTFIQAQMEAAKADNARLKKERK